MFDITNRASAASPLISSPEFLRIALSPLASGTCIVSITATTVDDEEPELLDQEILSATISSTDELLELIRTHVRIAPLPPIVS